MPGIFTSYQQRKRRNPANYKRLSPSELRERGLSPKAERYRLKGSTETISKRSYQQLQLNKGRKKTQPKITIEKRAEEHAAGMRRYPTQALAQAARGRKLRAELDRSENERLRDLDPPLKKDLTHIAFVKQRGEHLTRWQHRILGQIIHELGGDEEARALALSFIGSPVTYARAA
jgi:hypothetical protein